VPIWCRTPDRAVSRIGKNPGNPGVFNLKTLPCHALPALTKTVTAVNLFPAIGLERYLCHSTALVTPDIKHGAIITTSIPASLALAFGLATGRTACGLICKTFFPEKLLLTRGKNKFFAAVPALQGLVFKEIHNLNILLKIYYIVPRAGTGGIHQHFNLSFSTTGLKSQRSNVQLVEPV